MSEQIKILTAEQTALAAELTMTYGIEPDDVIFFTDDPKPFLTYEATCVLCNQLSDLHNIEIEKVQSFSDDSLSLKCILTLSNGYVRSAVGTANIKETIEGSAMSEQQAILLASSRAIRNALRTAGIDLMKLHRQATSGEVIDFKIKTNFASLLGQAHQLGVEALLINGDNKQAWYLQLGNRYRVNHSNELTEEQLADFVAFLRTLVSQPQRKAA